MDFSHTKLIFEDPDGSSYTAETKLREHHFGGDMTTLSTQPQLIPSEDIWPSVSAGEFTVVSLPIPDSVYVKTPGMENWSDSASGIFLYEAKICERLRRNPHPNIAPFLGCVVEDGMIKGLCFPKYRKTLREETFHSTEHIEKVLSGVKAGVDHLHSLGIIHVDLNESNVMLKEDGEAVIIDFDSLRHEGEPLGLKVGVASDGQNTAVREIDEVGLGQLAKFVWAKYHREALSREAPSMA